jgi:hypothetical protein
MRAMYNVPTPMPNFLDVRAGRRFAVLRTKQGSTGYALHLETGGVLRSWALADAPWDCGGCTAVQDVEEGS